MVADQDQHGTHERGRLESFERQVPRLTLTEEGLTSRYGAAASSSGRARRARVPSNRGDRRLRAASGTRRTIRHVRDAVGSAAASSCIRGCLRPDTAACKPAPAGARTDARRPHTARHRRSSAGTRVRTRSPGTSPRRSVVAAHRPAPSRALRAFSGDEQVLRSRWPPLRQDHTAVLAPRQCWRVDHERAVPAAGLGHLSPTCGPFKPADTPMQPQRSVPPRPRRSR